MRIIHTKKAWYPGLGNSKIRIDYRYTVGFIFAFGITLAKCVTTLIDDVVRHSGEKFKYVANSVRLSASFFVTLKLNLVKSSLSLVLHK